MAKPPTSPDDLAPTAADPFAWDPDPLVLVSKRARRFHVPRVLFDRDATDAERAAWYRIADDATPTARGDTWVTAQAGVTFLGTLMTSWADHRAQHSGQVASVPDMSRAVLVLPISQAQQQIKDNPANRDPATGRVKPAAVRTIFERVFGHVEETWPALFKAADAYDAPEMMLVRLSEVFAQNTPKGQQANAMITAAIPALRKVTHETVTPLGCLHDYAIRHRGGGAVAIMHACKAKAAKWKVG